MAVPVGGTSLRRARRSRSLYIVRSNPASTRPSPAVVPARPAPMMATFLWVELDIWSPMGGGIYFGLSGRLADSLAERRRSNRRGGRRQSVHEHRWNGA